MPALVSGAGAEVGVADAVGAIFLVVVGSAGVVVGALVSGALVSAGEEVVVDFFFATVVVVADLVLPLFVDVFATAALAADVEAFGLAGVAGSGAAAPFLLIADLIVVVGAALANVAVRNNPLSVTAKARGIRFDREGIIRTDYRTGDARPRISGYSPGHLPIEPEPKLQVGFVFEAKCL
jgi:hypothetical protein